MPTYYRREVSDGYSSSSTIPVLINVYAQLDPGTLTYNSVKPLNYGQDPGYIIETGGIAAACPDSRVYEWQYSLDNGITWLPIARSNNENYDPGSLTQPISFKRKVECSGQIAFTNAISINVYPALNPGKLNLLNPRIDPGTDPGIIPETPASGGTGGPYNYVWQTSFDGSTWSYLNHTEQFDPEY